MACDHRAQTSDSHDHSGPGDLEAMDHAVAPLAEGTSCPVESRSESAAPPRTIGSEELLQGQREVLILHAGETYRLRLTRNGKLILNK
jgi:hemin uptake protein HemP